MWVCISSLCTQSCTQCTPVTTLSIGLPLHVCMCRQFILNCHAENHTFEHLLNTSLRGVLASPKVVSRARRWSPVRAPLSLRLAAHKPTAQWPPAPPSTALEAPALGQLCLRSASAVTRWFKIPKGPKKRARTRTAQTQMVQPPTTASPRSPGGSARRQATTTAL